MSKNQRIIREHADKHSLRLITLIKKAYIIGSQFFKSADKIYAKSMTLAVFFMGFVVVATDVIFNYWYKEFFSSIEHKQLEYFFWLSAFFFFYVIFCAATVASSNYLQMRFFIKWREWLTSYFMRKYFKNNLSYKLELEPLIDNPDQRICEDIKQFINMGLELSLGLFKAFISIIAFSSILWSASTHIDFPLGKGRFIYIPGFLTWLALAYAFCVSWLTIKVGRPLIHLDYKQENLEGNMRFAFAQHRTYAESIAFTKEETLETKKVSFLFENIIENFLAIINRTFKIEFTSKGLNYASGILPIVAALPGLFLTQKIDISQLMQIIDAFGMLTAALFFIMDKYPLVAKWEAVIDRLINFEDHMNNHLETKLSIEVKEHQEKTLQLKDLTLYTPDGKTLLKNVSYNFLPATRYAIIGQPGEGKTVLLRALAGIWPYGTGIIQHEKNAHMVFIPQRPYLSGETLRVALLGIHAPQKKRQLEDYLIEFGLDKLVRELDHKADWNKTLSLGELQRLMILKAILAKPDILIMDESTSSMDDAYEAKIYDLLTKLLPEIMLIHITHHHAIKKRHDICLRLSGQTLKEVHDID